MIVWLRLLKCFISMCHVFQVELADVCLLIAQTLGVGRIFLVMHLN